MNTTRLPHQFTHITYFNYCFCHSKQSKLQRKQGPNGSRNATLDIITNPTIANQRANAVSITGGTIQWHRTVLPTSLGQHLPMVRPQKMMLLVDCWKILGLFINESTVIPLIGPFFFFSIEFLVIHGVCHFSSRSYAMNMSFSTLLYSISLHTTIRFSLFGRCFFQIYRKTSEAAKAFFRYEKENYFEF